MSTNELDQSIAAALRQMAGQVAKGVVEARRTCLNCENFNEQTEQCVLFNARPPARVIAFGCDYHAEVIPF